MQNLWTVQQYHMAYYGAISAVERGELALRYRWPWFVWSGGFIWTTGFGPLSDYTPEILSGAQQWFWWTIDSRTTSIPNVGMGNTDPMLSDATSKDYNQIWYINLETFLLSYDATSDTGAYYTWGKNTVFFSGEEITGVFRLPPKIFSGFWWLPCSLLCHGYEFGCASDSCDPDGDNLSDDVALSWSMQWLYKGNDFKIFPTMAVFYFQSLPYVNPLMDTVMRESLLNETGMLVHFTTSFSPIINGSNLDKHNVVGTNAAEIETWNFREIFTSADFSDLRLSFGAANLFRTFTGAIYPYLEYQFTFPQAIADRFYTIQWHGRVGEYDIQIVLKKPTVQGTVGGDFTVIF